MVNVNAAVVGGLKGAMRAQAQSQSDGPAAFCNAIVPNDDAELPGGVCRAIFVGVAGTVRVRDPRGNVFDVVSDGSQYHPIMVARVLATGTTATNILALY